MFETYIFLPTAGRPKVAQRGVLAQASGRLHLESSAARAPNTETSSHSAQFLTGQLPGESVPFHNALTLPLESGEAIPAPRHRVHCTAAVRN